MTIFDTKPMKIGQFTTQPNYDGIDFVRLARFLPLTKSECSQEGSVSKTRKLKKRVTFADDKGQPLFNVRTIDRTDVPSLDSLLLLANSKIISKTEDSHIKAIQPHDWVTSFIQPASVYSRFKTDLSKQNIKLATAVIVKNTLSDNEYEYELTGVIKVVNVCYQKCVFVRLSSDSKWTSSRDFDAKYKGSSCANETIGNSDTTTSTDEFEFQIRLPITLPDIPVHLEFVVAMETPNEMYWDNNNEKNYRIDYCQVSPESLPPTGLSPPTGGMYMATAPYTLDYKPNIGQYRNEYTKYRAWNHFSDEMSFY